MEIIRADQITPTAWKNGGGTTRALLSLPAGDGWHLRISMADVGHDGPFSPYPGVERWLTLVEGEGMQLEFEHRTLTLTPLDEPLVFDGAMAPHGRLLHGPVRDLNLMNKGGQAAMHQAKPGAPWRPRQRACGLFALRAGNWTCADGRRADLAAHTLLWLDEAPQAEMAFDQPGLWLEFSAPSA
ncbi:MAG TPA: HutD family protein [Roseateles sp.]